MSIGYVCAYSVVVVCFIFFVLFFFFKQKTAYELRISDWSSDVCSSDLLCHACMVVCLHAASLRLMRYNVPEMGRCKRLHAAMLRVRSFCFWLCELKCEIGRASCRERVCQYV